MNTCYAALKYIPNHREKLGITPEQDIVDGGLTLRHRSRQNKLLELERDLEKCRDELLSAKLQVSSIIRSDYSCDLSSNDLTLQNRKLTKELSKLHTEVNFCRLNESVITDIHQNAMLSDYGTRNRVIDFASLRHVRFHSLCNV